MKTPGQESSGPSRINLALMMRDHAGNNAKAIRKEIASLEKQIQLLRLELENLIKHASIEGVNLGEAPAEVAPEEIPVVTKIPAWLRALLAPIVPMLAVAWPAIVVGLLGWGAIAYYNGVQRERGAWNEREKMFHARLDSLERGIKAAQAQFKVDTVRLTKLKSHWDTVKAGVDTLRDTVRVPVEVVREIVHAADTTIKACTMAVTSCSAGWALERAKTATLTAEVAGWRRQANPPLLVRAGRMGKDYLILRAAEAVLVTVLRPK